jgi:hypothetical protein
MTCSDRGSGFSGCPPEISAPELEAQGWQRCFVADEPRLSEAVALYRELGFEVRLVPVAIDAETCTACMRATPDRFHVIYTRGSAAAAEIEQW